MPPAPKPVRKPKIKKPKGKTICIQCGFIVRGTKAEHFPHCLKEFGAITVRTGKTDKQMRELACDELCRRIVEWRDGVVCVLADIDGSKCSAIPNWGHVIPRGGSAMLVYELSNSFRQCSAHNIIHDKINPLLYGKWYQAKWGKRAHDMLEAAQRENIGKHLSAEDLHNTLVELSDLYDLRWSFAGASIEDMVASGFYGTIIQVAWIKDGRI